MSASTQNPGRAYRTLTQTVLNDITRSSVTPGPRKRLNRSEQAAVLGVQPATISAYRTRYGPDSTNPYPARRSDGTCTLTQLTAWSARRRGVGGRPRVRPAGVTMSQWRALADVRDGQPIGHVMTRSLTWAGLLRHDGRLTRKGQAVIAAYPNAPRLVEGGSQ